MPDTWVSALRLSQVGPLIISFPSAPMWGSPSEACWVVVTLELEPWGFPETSFQEDAALCPPPPPCCVVQCSVEGPGWGSFEVLPGVS